MALVVAVTAGDVDVVSSGTLMLNKGQRADFYLSGMHRNGFRIEIEFLNDEGETQEIIAKVVNDQHFHLTFRNLRSPLSAGNSRPLYVANHDGRKVYLSVVTHVLGLDTDSEVRVVQYQVGLGESV